jgi:hypothetical protein
MSRYGQRGVAMPLVVVGLLAILAVAGLALDSSHALANKTRLQNFVDAAALTAAKEISLGADTGQASAAALGLLSQIADGPGNHELKDAYGAGEGDITITIQYSETVDPFVPGAPEGPNVRVIAENFDIQTTLSRVLGINEIPVAASAVAGPSPTIDTACNVAPLVVCAEDISQPLFGFQSDMLQVLKPDPGIHDEVGPGNYKLLRMDCGSGGGAGPCLRENMAGGFGECLASDQPVETEPGVMAGPTIQGFNTRFGSGGGGGLNVEDYPPDVVVTAPTPELTTENGDSRAVFQNGERKEFADDINYSYTDYTNDSKNGVHQYPPPTGAYGRRVVALPVADCSGDESGQSTLDVNGFACFFLLQPILGGSEKNIFGQFVTDCVSGGTPGPDPNNAEGPHVIQLYKDPDSNDS